MDLSSRQYSMETVLWFGKHKGKKIKEVMNDEPTYVTKFLMHDNKMRISGAVAQKVVKDYTFGYKAGEGLVENWCFYEDYVIVKRDELITYIDASSGIEVKAESLKQAEVILNNRLSEYYADRSGLNCT